MNETRTQTSLIGDCLGRTKGPFKNPVLVRDLYKDSCGDDGFLLTERDSSNGQEGFICALDMAVGCALGWFFDGLSSL